MADGRPDWIGDPYDYPQDGWSRFPMNIQPGFKYYPRENIKKVNGEDSETSNVPMATEPVTGDNQ